MAINFVLENFETVINLDVSGTMLGEIFTAIDASACAEIQIDLAMAKEAFQFQSDSSDVLNASSSDVKFYLNEDNFWNCGLKYNVADGNLVAGGATGPIASGFATNKNMVCHDFVRYLSEQLFNTHRAVDLFDNELELLNDIRDNARAVWDTMEVHVNRYKEDGGTGHGGISLENDSASLLYSTNDHTESITRRLYEQMIYTASGRDRFKNIITGAKQGLPFAVNDTIEIKLTINPQADQHTLVTGVSALGARTYKIIFIMKDIPSYVSRDPNEGFLHLAKV
jgi:hypothetical protein